MTIVTRLTLSSGDRAALDGVVTDIKESAHRKGAQLKGPHSEAPTELSVPQYARLDGDDDERFDDWSYTVYTRRMEIVGHDALAQEIVDDGFPHSVRAEVELEQIRGAGR
ncbi:MAG: 30S ribosomal protein S10 [Halobacteriaceae archaeon]